MDNAAFLWMQEKVDGSQTQIHNDMKEPNGTRTLKVDEDEAKDNCFIFAWRKLLKDKLQPHRYWLHCGNLGSDSILMMSIFTCVTKQMLTALISKSKRFVSCFRRYSRAGLQGDKVSHLPNKHLWKRNKEMADIWKLAWSKNDNYTQKGDLEDINNDHLVGLVVKAPALRTEDPGFESRSR